MVEYHLKEGYTIINPDCIFVSTFRGKYMYHPRTEVLQHWKNFDCTKCRIKSKCLNPEAYSKTTWGEKILPNLVLVT